MNNEETSYDNESSQSVHRSPFTVLLPCLLLLTGLSSVAAQERMYWTDNLTEKIQRADLDGSNREVPVAKTIGNASGLALDVSAGKMYWSDWTEGEGVARIRRADLDGSNREVLVTAEGESCGIALDLDAGKVYWTHRGAISRADLDGSNEESLVTGLDHPLGIALDVSAGKMYWTDPVNQNVDGKILRADLEIPPGETNSTRTDVENLEPWSNALDGPYPWSIALDVSAGKMYWTDIGPSNGSFRVGIWWANLDGSNEERLVLTTRPYGIALDVSAGKMYWTDRTGLEQSAVSRIRRADLDGSNEEVLVTAEGESQSIALDLDAGKMYWIHDYHLNVKIRRADLDGSNAEDVAEERVLEPEGLALDVSAGKMYWTDAAARSIRRADLNGENPEDLVSTGLTGPGGITLDVSAGKMYWTEEVAARIRRADLGGSNQADLVTGLDRPYGIALHVSAGKIYWTELGAGKIKRADLNGTNDEALVTENLVQPRGIALDISAGKMYWTDHGTGRIQQADLDGGNVEDLVTIQPGVPWGIALDVSADKMYWTSRWQAARQKKVQRADLDGGNVEDLVTVAVEYDFILGFIGQFGITGIALELEPSDLAVSPTGIDFGMVATGTERDTTFTLTNTNQDTLAITGVTTTDSVFTVADTTLALAPGDTATLSVTFAPTGRGSVNAQVVLTSDAPSSPHVVGVRGEGRTVQTMAIAADTSTVVYQDADGTVTAVTFTDGQVTGHRLAVETFGTSPPSSVQSVPQFSDPVFYVGFDTTIPDSVSFQATVTFIYTDAQLDSAGVTDEDSLKVAWFNPTTQVWSTVTGVLDVGSNRLTFTTDHFSVFALAMITPTGIEDGPRASLPSDFILHGARPNPFNPSTTISYEVARPAHVTLVVYNILGQEVSRLVDGQKAPGRYVVVWNGKNVQGRGVASGIYVYRLTSSTGFTRTKRMTLIK